MSYWRLDRPTSRVGLSPRDLRLHRVRNVLSQNNLTIACPDHRPGIARPAQLRPIQGAADPAATPIQYMSVDHRRAHILVAKKFLHRPDVVVVELMVAGSAEVGSAVAVAGPARG